MNTVVVVLSVVAACFGQRGSYAGRRGIGYPSIEFTTPTTTIAVTTLNNDLGQRSGASDVTSVTTSVTTPPTTTTTTVRLPVEANGDTDLVTRLSRLPVEQQPFWLLNQWALDAFRNQPRSYGVQRNNFIDFASVPNRQNSF